MNMEINTPKSKSISSNTNTSRKLLVFSNTSSTSYIKRMEAQIKDLSYVD